MSGNIHSVSEAASAPSRLDLSLLVCPVCRSPLVIEAVGGAAPSIRCTGCERRYPIVDGLPVLLAERAELTSTTKV